jgi:uncharacterized protein with NRDE domain
MCTVSFIARRHGYLLAMNRDENLTRVKGLPAKEFLSEGRRVICPAEPSGGTWIALNDAGVTYALINWYSVNASVRKNPVSRGVVVSSVSTEISADTTGEILTWLPLGQINPFRLLGFLPATREIYEWRWDLKRLVCKKNEWRAQQFISSGFDEPGAQKSRGKLFSTALQQNSAGSLTWLRRLHRSHQPMLGPYSTCMHRADAATVSYTEIAVSPHEALMCYYDNAPCQNAKGSTYCFKMERTNA